MGQDAGILDIAQNDGNFRRNFSRSDGIGDGHEIGAFAGTENAESKWFAHGVLNSRARGDFKVERKSAVKFNLPTDCPPS
jgi:hypothetical protein